MKRQEAGSPARLADLLPLVVPPDTGQLELFNQEIAYTARLLGQISLPHKRPSTSEVTIPNGALTVKLVAPQDPGLPFGLYGRRIFAWMVTSAVRLGSPLLPLGKSHSAFAQTLHITPTTGPNGSLPQLKSQLRRMIGLSIHATHATRGERRSPADPVGPSRVETVTYAVTSRSRLWWDADTQDGPSQNYVLLSADFFHDLVDRPIPFKLQTFLSLRSTLAQDLYIFLTYRALRTQRLGRAEYIPLDALQEQLATSYGSKKDFRKELRLRLAEVLKVYPEARVHLGAKHLVLNQYRPHVPPLQLLSDKHQRDEG